MAAQRRGEDPPDDHPVDYQGVDLTWQEIGEQRESLCERSLALPASTMAELLLKARIVPIENFFGIIEDDSVVDGAAIKKLLDDMCQLIGAELLPALELEEISEAAGPAEPPISN